MPAKDLYHEQVRRALVKDGWRITHDPLTIKYKGSLVFIDLGAEKPETPAGLPLAIEVKMLGNPLTSEFEKAFGQYALYRFFLERKGSGHVLFLALSEAAYASLKQFPALLEFLTEERVNLLIFDPVNEEVVQWFK